MLASQHHCTAAGCRANPSQLATNMRCCIWCCWRLGWPDAKHAFPPPTHPPTHPSAQFLSVLMRPNAKYTAKLRKLMAHSFSHTGSDHFSAEGAGEDMFPYVSFTLNIEG